MPRDLDIAVIDDDDSYRVALVESLSSLGYGADGYASAEDYIGSVGGRYFNCVVTDIHMPGMSGLDLQDELKRRGYTIPIIFITGHADVPMAVSAVKKGAIEFIEKPFNDQAFLVLINNALGFDAQTRGAAEGIFEFLHRQGGIVQGTGDRKASERQEYHP